MIRSPLIIQHGSMLHQFPQSVEVSIPLTYLNDTTPCEGGVVHFLGMDISSSSANRGRFRLSVVDKRKAFSFPVRRYPQMTSLIPLSTACSLHNYIVDSASALQLTSWISLSTCFDV